MRTSAVLGVGRGITGGGENVVSCRAETGSRISGAGAGAGAAETGVARLVDLETAGDSTRAGVIGGTVLEVKVVPSSRLTSFRDGSLPEKNSPALKEGSEDGARGKISDWKESDYRFRVKRLYFVDKVTPTFRGTMNETGSIAVAVTL